MQAPYSHETRQLKRFAMNEIVEILMRRDGISQLEAENLVEECKEELWEASARGSYQECEDIVASYLGLEPDYLEFLLW